MIKKIVYENTLKAIKAAIEDNNLGELKSSENIELAIEKTKNPQFGDYSVNVSPLARYAKLPPQKIAENILPYVNLEDMEVSIVAGFINFKVGQNWLTKGVNEIITSKEKFGSNNIGNNEKVLLEYVSANPTGPLHIGHGRWAAVGSSLANLMKFSGYDVDQEFYINDAGNQINNLGRSLWIRVLQELGYEAKIPKTEEEGSKNYYPGEYLIDIAKDYLKDNSDTAKKLFEQNPNPLKPSDEIIKAMSDYAKAIILEQQKELLAKFKVDFDTWYGETSLHASGEVEKTFQQLQQSGKIYENEGAYWFKSSEYGDDQDRVIKKTDGSNTYLTADIAYHYDKLKRGYKKLINIWGADHHGYVPRMKAAIEALGYDSNSLEVLLGQLVNLVIDGEQVRMGKRKKMLTLEDLIDEVGVDATRYWMIMRSIDTTLDFDVELAKSCSDENPVYYVQYAHARACSILRNAVSERFDQETKETLPPFIQKDKLEKIFNSSLDVINNLWNTENSKEIEATKNLVLKLEYFEELISNATKARAPYMIARYVQELAADFHHFYTFTRVLNVEDSLMKARLVLVYATKQVLANGLSLLGVHAPESM